MGETRQGPQAHPPPHARPSGISLLEMERPVYFTKERHPSAYDAPMAPGAVIWDFGKGAAGSRQSCHMDVFSIFRRDQWLLQASSSHFGSWKWGFWPADLLGLARKMRYRISALMWSLR